MGSGLDGCEDVKIGVYCWTGPDRATPAANALHRAGFTKVYDLGGIQYMDDLNIPISTGEETPPQPKCADPDTIDMIRFAPKEETTEEEDLDSASNSMALPGLALILSLFVHMF